MDTGADQNVVLTPDLIKPTPPHVPVPEEPLEHFLETIKEEIILPRSAVLSESQAVLSISTFASQQKLTINQSKTVMTILFQSGGTAKGCDGNLTCSIFGQTIKLAYLRKALTEAKCKGMERKLARYLADEIAQISIAIKIPGNLTKKITRAHPERAFTQEESAWLSDFQVDNSNCPELLRNFISESFSRNKTEENISKPKQKFKPSKKK
jgi:hypothetical protein